MMALHAEHAEMIKLCSNFNVTSCLDIMEKEGLQTLINRRCHFPDQVCLTVELSVDIPHGEIIGTNSHQNTNVTAGHRKYNMNKMRGDFMTSNICRQAMLILIDKIECNREEQAEIDKIYNEFTNNVITEMNNSNPNYDTSYKTKKRHTPRKTFWNDELQNLWNEMHQKEKLINSCKNKRDRQSKFKAFKESQNKIDKK